MPASPGRLPGPGLRERMNGANQRGGAKKYGRCCRGMSTFHFLCGLRTREDPGHSRTLERLLSKLAAATQRLDG